MEKLYGDGHVLIRKMVDCKDDYMLMSTWLTNPDVCEYYEGKTKPLGIEKVMEKFAHRVRCESRVIMCIIHYDDKAIGFIQFYQAEPDEYSVSDIIDMTKYNRPFGIDIVIGEPIFWNKGIGTDVVRLTIQYLFQHRNADIIFIDPQTWNTRAVKCYEKSGFVPLKIIKQRELHDGEYKDSLIMYITQNGKPVCHLQADGLE